jgi:raffinose/stachyose/melibiose transport system substrate-binding protein
MHEPGIPSLGVEPTKLRLWWWGAEEAAGLTGWLADTASRFEAETGVGVEITPIPTDDVIDGFTAAAEAGDPADIQYLWNGIYHMENVWKGYVEPLNGLVSRSVLVRSGATPLSRFEGKQYRTGFYASGFGVSFNKPLFERAGLDADNPPRTWDTFLQTCDRLKAAGIPPFGGGARDGYFGDWYFTNALIQNLNSPAEAISLFIGNLDWRESRYLEHWARLEELTRFGFLNDEISELDHFQGLARFDEGKLAMCLYTTAALIQAQERLGAGNVGLMVMPVWGSGRMAGIPILDAHGFGIPSGSADKANAARFIEYMHTKERLQAMWRMARQIPSDEAFDASIVDDPFIKQIYDRWVAGPHNVFIGDLMPTRFWTEVMFVASRRIVAGEIGAEEAADLAFAVTEEWKAANPDMVNNYARWGRELGL